jgi:hypothetical protein
MEIYIIRRDVIIRKFAIKTSLFLLLLCVIGYLPAKATAIPDYCYSSVVHAGPSTVSAYG